MSRNFVAITITQTGINITTGAASASATIPNAADGNLPRYIRVVATVAACVRLGATTATAVATDLQIQPGDSVIMRVPSGMTKIAAIQVAAAGVVQVSPLDDL